MANRYLDKEINTFLQQKCNEVTALSKEYNTSVAKIITAAVHAVVEHVACKYKLRILFVAGNGTYILGITDSNNKKVWSYDIKPSTLMILRNAYHDVSEGIDQIAEFPQSAVEAVDDFEYDGRVRATSRRR